MKKFLVVLTLAAVVMPFVASAQSTACTIGSSAGPRPDVGVCVSQIYLWALGAAGILAIIMAIIGGYLVVMSAGNAAQASKGKSYLFSSIVGIIILLGAFFILYTVNPDLTSFNTRLNCLNTPPPNTAPPANCQ